MNWLDGKTTGPLGETVDGTYPVVADKNGKRRFLVQTSAYGRYLGNLELTIDDEGNIKDVAPESNPMLLSSEQGFDVLLATQCTANV